MIKYLFTLLLLFVGFSLKAQTDPSAEVVAVVQDIFDGMRAGDSTRVASHFLRDASMMSVSRNKEGQSVLQEGSLQKWLDAIGTPRETILDERLWGIEVQIDDNLATLWTNYAFYVGSEYSHCGIDVFQLFHDGSAWKVYHVSDTRRKECDIPEKIKNNN
jgi:hypothetical protein